MKAQIKSIFCSDVPDLAAWRPAGADDVYLGLELEIGQVGSGGANLFQVVVATPAAIAGRPERRRGKLLVVQRYDWEEIRRTLEEWVWACDGPDWMAIVNCLRRRFHWEFDGMGPP